MRKRKETKSEYLTVRIPTPLKYKIVQMAILQERTVSWIAAKLLAEAIKKEEKNLD